MSNSTASEDTQTPSSPAAPPPERAAQTSEAAASQPLSPGEPTEELILCARRKITLQCGQSSITLHPNGKIVLRGEYILSAAEGTNRIVGGQIEIN